MERGMNRWFSIWSPDGSSQLETAMDKPPSPRADDPAKVTMRPALKIPSAMCDGRTLDSKDAVTPSSMFIPMNMSTVPIMYCSSLSVPKSIRRTEPRSVNAKATQMNCLSSICLEV